jgi:8-oxo-dGTP pyrophosphatase MutT (NUDIX family)
MPWTSSFKVDETTRSVTILYDPSTTESDILREILTLGREKSSFKVLKGWRNELYPVLGINRDVCMERAGSALFGIHTIGVHMICYVRPSASCRPDEIKTWVARRAATKQTYGGMLDNTVAGGIAAGEDPFESIVREAGEEASLPENLVRQNTIPCGTVSYVHVRDHRAGGEIGLLQPETQYLYDLELEEHVVPKPSDDEVEGFVLWSMEKAKQALGKGEFKPNCAMVLIDFMIRHGVITAREEADYVEIVSRLHRRIRF